ncbi:MAG: VanW family protein [Anaerotignum sp.]
MEEQVEDKLGKTGKAKGVFLGLAVLSLCLCCGYFAYGYMQNQKVKEILAQSGIYQGVSIDGIDVGGLSKEEAIDTLIHTHGKDISGKKITLYYEAEEWSYSFEDIGAGFDVEEAVEAAYNFGRTGTLEENEAAIITLIKDGQEIPLNFSYDDMKMQDKLIEVAGEFNQVAKNSTLERSNGQFIVGKEAKGRELDVESTMLNVDTVIATMESGRAGIVANLTEPKITYEDNQYVTDLIGSFSTKYTAYDKNRNTNLTVGCNYLNGTIIADGEVFSASEGLGDQTYARGYRDAGVYVNGKVEAGMGGGVCQITSTLYNAAIFAELEIVERHPHSMTVGYVPLGRDAAIADYYKDLKIKNNTGHPIYLETYAYDGVLQVNIYGYEVHEAGREVAFETVYEATIPKPEEIVTEDDKKPEGEREVTHKGRTGAKVSVYKKILQDGKQTSNDWFSSSSYRAVADEVTVGTKKPEEKKVEVEAQAAFVPVPQEPSFVTDAE